MIRKMFRVIGGFVAFVSYWAMLVPLQLSLFSPSLSILRLSTEQRTLSNWTRRRKLNGCGI